MKGMLTDVTKCIGCGQCVKGCTEANRLQEQPSKLYHSRDGLSGQRFTTVIHIKKDGEDRYVRKHCRHCIEPACASACIVGALQKTPEGAVIYDDGMCIGCRYCMMACPFGIPKYEWASAVPYVRKCTLCYERFREGTIPACVEACPEQATIFGDRDELIAAAQQLIKDNPGKYIDRVYGEKEIGGTAVMYISDAPLDFLAWKPNLDERPLPRYTWAALSKVPGIAFGVAAGMTGLYWIIERRMKLSGGEPSPTAEGHHE
ncbi:MAG: 4Fe-4S dicluster domain-containing protein [Candidatus Omnitrophota bacterium]